MPVGHDLFILREIRTTYLSHDSMITYFHDGAVHYTLTTDETIVVQSCVSFIFELFLMLDGNPEETSGLFEGDIVLQPGENPLVSGRT